MCSTLDAQSPWCAVMAGGGPEKAAAGILADVRTFRKTVLGTLKSHRPPKVFQRAAFACDLAAAQLTYLWTMGVRARHDRDGIFWPGASQSNAVRGLLRVLASQLCANLFVVRNLAVAGLDPQARSLFRVFVELADLLAATAADHSMATRYATSTNGLANPNWESFKPGRVRKLLSAVDNELVTAFPDVPAAMADLREGTYEWLSAFSHAHYMAQVTCAMWFERHVLGSEITAELKQRQRGMSYATLSRAAWYSCIAISQIEKLLRERHGWEEQLTGSPPDRRWFEVSRLRFFYGNKVVSEFTSQYVIEMEFAQAAEVG